MEEICAFLNLKHTNNPTIADVYLPCGYTSVERELQRFTPRFGQTILALRNCDEIVTKNGLWRVLSNEYGRENAAKLTPKSYETGSGKDLRLFAKEFDPQRIYILKKNIQRQQGLKLSRNIKELLTAQRNGYIVIQQYMMNPLLIDGRKFDIRIYLLIIEINSEQRFYRHVAGRCHYATKNFSIKDLDRQIHIPNGYKEDHAFKGSHPETLTELQNYMNKRNREGDYFFARIDAMLRDCCRVFAKVLGRSEDKGVQLCQLFGIDIMGDEELNPFLIEVNKGPDMTWSSEKEYGYKKGILLDMFNLLGYGDRSENGFRRL